MDVNVSETVFPNDSDYGTPNHMIIWLDAHIGDLTKYIEFRKVFSNNIDPRSQTYRSLSDGDFHNLLVADSAMTVTFGGVPFLLLAFTEPDACYAAFQRYRNHRIFFITSGTLGEFFIPRILPDFQDVFTDPLSNDPYNSIYIFCGKIENYVHWAIKYRVYIQMFDHEADLLVRMVRDAAEYLCKEADREPTEHPNEALRYYGWSKKLFLQYERLGEKAGREITAIDGKIAVIERNQQNVHMAGSDEDEEKGAEPCS